jgi:acetolactate synthase I/II/III large subunit
MLDHHSLGMEDRVAEKERILTEEETTVAKLLVRCLENESVRYVFGIPGEENIHFIDALNSSSIRFILVHHEQSASFMAEMYGRVTARLGYVAPLWDLELSTCCWEPRMRIQTASP